MNGPHHSGIKKLSADRLRPGMYIHDLNCGWMDHPFARSRFLIKDARTIETIVSHGIREVYIDTNKGRGDQEAAPEAVVTQALRAELQQVVERAEKGVPDSVSMREERRVAARIMRDSSILVGDMMREVKLGRQIECERVEPVVGEMVSSVFRNQDAMLSLQRVRSRDQYTYEHSVGVAVLLVVFAKELGLAPETITALGVGRCSTTSARSRFPTGFSTSRAG